MTLEGAPHLKPEHLAVFDCAAPTAGFGVRRVSAEAQIKMQAALETFLSGAAAHTVLLDHHTSIEEVQKLIADYSEKEWLMPAFSATGFKEVRAFLEDKISKEQMIELWTRRELQYAKRQLTWWKKEPNVRWFDVTKSGWKNSALEMLYSFYAQNL